MPQTEELYEQLLEFVYASPGALIRMSERGDIEMMNAMGANLLSEVSPTPQLSNLFDIFQEAAPHLRSMVASFSDERGVVCKGYKVAFPADRGREPMVLAMDLIKLGLNRVMAALHDISTLESAHRARRFILDTVSDGLVTVDARGRMSDECSAPLRKWLGAPRNGQWIWEYMARAAPAFADSLEVGWEMIADDVLPLEICLLQLPKRLDVGGVPLGVSYEPQLVDGTLAHILLVVRDLTEQLERERLDCDQRELMEVLSCLTRDREGFRAFLEEMDRLVLGLLGSIPSPDERSTTLRALHTLKGNAGSYGLVSVVRLCHDIETRLEDGGARLDWNERERLKRCSGTVVERFAPFVAESMGDITMTSEEHAELVRGVRGASSTKDVVEKIELLALGSVQAQLSRFVAQAGSLARRLEKAPLRVRVDAHGLRHSSEHFRSFWGALAHAIRNAVDHGVETANERMLAGKPAEATLDIVAHALDGGMVVEVSDDGRGIDWARLAAKAKAFGLPTDTRADLAAALFRDGTSTRDSVTETSGRGVGMGALKAACEALGGAISVESTPGKGTTVRFQFPWLRPAVNVAA
jgi:two-component system, chemotaxis family, sensor kinase CheA